MPKLAWVLIPLAVYAAILAVLAWRGRAPARMAINVHTSLLLMAYLLTTAGLGIFWVANQQLPVFDWHYLFGYATLALVAIHLIFNLPIVVRWFARKAAKPAARQPGGPRLVLQAAALAAAFGVAFYVGTRQADDALPPPVATDVPASVQAVIQYHAFSTASRSGVFKRAAGVEWGSPPPPFKRYEQAKTIALTRGAPGGASLGDMLAMPASGRGRLNLARLGEMLYLSAGITLQRGGNALRAAPSSGALFPSELYVIARSVDGLEPGLYHYDPEHHRLDVLGALPATLGAAEADQADAAIVLSAVFRRTGYKYHNRAYRYAAADAGHLLENVRLGAHRAAMHARLLQAFDDAAAARAIRVDGVEEGVLAVMALNRRPASAPPQPERFAPVASVAPSALGVTGIVQRATSLQREAAPTGEVTALPAPQPFTRDLHETIVKRRSERRFSGEALPLSSLSSLLAASAQPAQLSGALQLNLVVNRVAGLAPGVYRYLPPQHALLRLRGGDHQAAVRSAALSQDVIGDAAAVLILSADRDQLLAEGARGYRHVLLEAGLIGERWLLGSTAAGLAACPVGAFYDDEAAALIKADPARHWVLHFAAVGIRAP